MTELREDAVKTPAALEATSNVEKVGDGPKDHAAAAAVAMTGVALVSEVQLTAATGGTELSCYRCMVPFGVVVLIAGVVVTAVAYSFNTHGSTISVLGLVLLSLGLLLLGASAACWKVRRERQKERRRESQAALVAARGASLLRVFFALQNPGGNPVFMVLKLHEPYNGWKYDLLSIADFFESTK